MILIGVDPHKSSHTAVAVDAAGRQVARRRFVVNAGTFGQLMRWCQQWPERRFAIEGTRGLGRTLAQQLAAVGEDVVDVPSTLPGLGTVLATKVLGHVGDISRFPTEHHFASYTGNAPLDASSGATTRHRLNTRGNRALNAVLHIIAV